MFRHAYVLFQTDQSEFAAHSRVCGGYIRPAISVSLTATFQSTTLDVRVCVRSARLTLQRREVPGRFHRLQLDSRFNSTSLFVFGFLSILLLIRRYFRLRYSTNKTRLDQPIWTTFNQVIQDISASSQLRARTRSPKTI